MAQAQPLTGMTAQQLHDLIVNTVNTAVGNLTLPPGPQGQQGPAGNDGQDGRDGIDGRDGTNAAGGSGGPPRWNPGELGFFDPNYDGKSVSTGSAIEHAGKETYFRDVHLFIDRAKDIAAIKEAKTVRENLWMSLRGTALEWWTAEMSPAEKRLTILGDSVDEWSTLLIARFKEPSNVAIDAVLRERYSLRDANSKREPREYAQKILRSAKDAGMSIVKTQLDIVYNGIDLELRRDIKKPGADATVNSFLKELDECKHEWWAYASRHGKNAGAAGSQASRQQNRAADNRGNYNQFPRQQGPGYGQQSYGQQSYGRQPFQPYYQPYYQSSSSRQFNSPNAYSNNQPQQYGQSSNAPRQGLPAPRQPLQITAPSTSDSTTRSQSSTAPRNQGFPRSQGSGFQRGRQTSWQPRNAGGFRQKAYHASTEEDGEENTHSQDDGNDDEESYHNDHDESSHGDFGNDNLEQDSFEQPENYFTAAEALPAIHACRGCDQSFQSRNALFRHLKEAWQSPEAHVCIPEAQVVTTEAQSGTPKVIESSSKASATPGYAFRGYHYARAQLKSSPDAAEAMPGCLDTGAGITLLDRLQRTKHFPDSEISKMSSPIRVRGLGNTMHTTDEFVTVTTYSEGELPDGSRAVAKMTMEAHLVDDLKANMLIGNDVLTAQKIKLDPGSGMMTIGSCQNLTAKIDVITKDNSRFKRTIRSQGTVVIPAMSTVSVPVTYRGTIPEDRDFLFEPQCKQDLGHDGGVYAHVVDSSLSFVQLSNTTDHPTQITRRTRLGSVVEFGQEGGCYLAEPEAAPLAAGGWMSRKPKQSWKSRIAKALMTVAATAATAATVYTASGSSASDKNASPTTVDPSLEHVLPNGITVYGSQEEASQIAAVAQEFPEIWTDRGTTVDIPENEWMPIHLKPDAVPKPSRVYPVGKKDRDIIDETFNEMHEHGKLEWVTQPTKFSYPCFVVWRDTPAGRKGRVVIDIRGLNKIAETDSYPMPLQSDLISAIAGYRYITIVDARGYFHQFLVKITDRDKLTIVSHRGQERSNVALMGYKGSPPYVQRQTDKMLRPFKDFTKAYVDDIIIFSHTLQEHLTHLRKVFSLFQEKRVSLSPRKSYLGYPSVNLLGQHVDSLGMATSADKICAIKAIDFPRSLRDLEIYLGLTGWLRSSIHRYAQIVKPLQERKTKLTRELPTKDGSQAKGPARKQQSAKMHVNDPTEEEIQAYQQLQAAFDSPIFLAHYDRIRRLYIDIDSSKSWGFAAMVYHVKGDPDIEKSAIPRTSVQPIMFLSKLLNEAEKGYWPTELEVAGIVWVVKKLRHMIESSSVPPVIIYTDHSAAVPISRQTTLTTSSTDKLNLRLVRASQYLSGFELSIRHKAGKSNVVPDALSRLPGNSDKGKSQEQSQEGILDVLYGHAVKKSDMSEEADAEIVYHITLVEMSDDFKSRLRKAYKEDDQWKRILEMLSRNDTPGDPPAEIEKPGLRFKLRNDLIYYVSGDGRERLCIPQAMEKDVFHMAHDLSNHGGFHRSYDRLSSSVYIRQLSRRLRSYIMHCPDCQVFQTARHSPYGSLNPIVTPAIPFHTLAMDFVVELPEIDGHDVLLTMTDKFTKKVLLISGRNTWNAADWANVVIVALLERDWGIPRSFISDRDSKFMSAFWKAIFGKLQVSFLTSTAYHPQTDGQSERTNQTVEIALRYYVSRDINWRQALPFISAILNNSTNTATGFSPNELTYGFRVNDNVNLLEDLPPQDFEKLRLLKREAADEAISFANAMSKHRYDGKHTPLSVKPGDKVYLRLHHGYKIAGEGNHKLHQQRAGPFEVLRKVGNLAYELKLSPIMKIHPVVSIAQLEPAPPGEDPYHRPRPTEPPAVTDADRPPGSYELEKLLERRINARTGKPEYLVKWKDYGSHHNAWYKLEDLDFAKDLIDDYERKHNPSQQIPTKPSQQLLPPEQLSKLPEPPPQKKRLGRPRKLMPAQLPNPPPDQQLPKKTVGRPRKDPSSKPPPRLPDPLKQILPSQNQSQELVLRRSGRTGS